MSGATARERQVAYRVLRRVDGGAYADRALRGEAGRADLDQRDWARALRLSYGVVQRRRTLDWVVDGCLDRRRDLEPEVRDILRLGAYELLFSDGAPDRAVVDQAVRLARAVRGSSARRSARGGLVNAVLRRLASEGDEALTRLDAEGTAGLRFSLPDWIADGLATALGDEAPATMAAFNERPEAALRWNPLRGPRTDVERVVPDAERDARVPEAYVAAPGFAFDRSPFADSGKALGQSRASMVPARALDPRPGERVLDLCAAPGAKATHLAALAHGGARVTAVELHESRARALERLAARMGARVEVVVGDGRSVALEGPFDAALVDPPCTGLGVLAGRPDARWRRRPEAVEPLVDLQRALLERALSEVRPGGRVVYSTCTLLAAENEDVVAGVGAPLDDLGPAFPGWEHPHLAGALRTLPGRDRTDGFFVARLRVDSAA